MRGIPPDEYELSGEFESFGGSEERPDSHAFAETGDHSGALLVGLKVANHFVKPVVVGRVGRGLGVGNTYAYILCQTLEHFHQRTAIISCNKEIVIGIYFRTNIERK